MADTPDDADRDESVLDHIDALRVLRADDDDEKGRVLEAIGARGPAEREMVAELAATDAVARPAEFERAHRQLIHALEVLDRNGAREVTVRAHLGPLRPAAAWLVQVVTRWIVKSHVNTLVTEVRRLYERREAAAEWGSAEHHLLRRARMGIARVEAGMRGNPVGVPAFLVGGAFVTGMLSATLSGLDSARRIPVLLLVVAAVAVLALVALSWVAIYAAAVARHRIRLTTDWAVGDLYRAIGAAGDPPRDQSYNFAIVAIALILLALVVVPLATWWLAASA